MKSQEKTLTDKKYYDIFTAVINQRFYGMSKRTLAQSNMALFFAFFQACEFFASFFEFVFYKADDKCGRR